MSPSQRGPVECWMDTDTDAPSRSTPPLCQPSGAARWYWSLLGWVTVPSSRGARVAAIASGATGNGPLFARGGRLTVVAEGCAASDDVPVAPDGSATSVWSAPVPL